MQSTFFGTSNPALLDDERLRSYGRLLVVEEILGEYAPRLIELVGAVCEGMQRGDHAKVAAALHMILGMSGEAGAKALYQHVRAIYVPMREFGRWPADPGWLDELTGIAIQTNEALRDFCGQPGTDGQ